MSNFSNSPKERPERRFKAVIFDIDGTIFSHVSSWRYIHERLGLWDALAKRYQDRFQKGLISYREFCRLDAAHWKGMRSSKLRRIFSEVPYSLNAQRTIQRLRRIGFKIAAVSTGIQFITDRAKKELCLGYVLGNRLLERGGVLTGGVRVNISHGGKGEIVERVARRFNVKPREIVAVGDSEGDIPVAKRCGYAVSFNSTSRELDRLAHYVCRTKDFAEVGRVIEGLLSLPAESEELS